MAGKQETSTNHGSVKKLERLSKKRSASNERIASA